MPACERARRYVRTEADIDATVTTAVRLRARAPRRGGLARVVARDRECHESRTVREISGVQYNRKCILYTQYSTEYSIYEQLHTVYAFTDSE